MITKVHILDSDCRRRAQVARELLGRNFHAEIYESIEELFGSNPQDGLIFASEDEASAPLGGSSPLALPVVVYGVEPSIEDVVEAMQKGALDYLEWPLSADQFDAMLRRVGEQGIHKAALLQRQSQARKALGGLTRRERDVLLELVEGYSNKEAGERLGISSRTVEIHRANVMRKLNAKSAAAAVRIALLGGLEENFPEAA